MVKRNTNLNHMTYFRGPMGAVVKCNHCSFSISTAGAKLPMGAVGTMRKVVGIHLVDKHGYNPKTGMVSGEVEAHELFKIWEPDTVAECLEGVSKVEGLYGRLWDLVEEAYKGYEKPETPDTYHGHVFGNDLAKVWGRLSDEDKTKLNELAVAHELED